MCSAHFFFCFASNHNNICIHKKKPKKHFNTSKMMFVHNVWSSSCWCAISLGWFPLTTISFFSPLFSPLCAASALTGKSTLLLFISKPRRAAWLACSDCLCKGCLPKLHLKHWLRHGCNLVQGFFLNGEAIPFVWLTHGEWGEAISCRRSHWPLVRCQTAPLRLGEESASTENLVNSVYSSWHWSDKWEMMNAVYFYFL